MVTGVIAWLVGGDGGGGDGGGGNDGGQAASSSNGDDGPVCAICLERVSAEDGGLMRCCDGCMHTHCAKTWAARSYEDDGSDVEDDAQRSRRATCPYCCVKIASMTTSRMLKCMPPSGTPPPSWPPSPPGSDRAFR